MIVFGTKNFEYNVLKNLAAFIFVKWKRVGILRDGSVNRSTPTKTPIRAGGTGIDSRELEDY